MATTTATSHVSLLGLLLAGLLLGGPASAVDVLAGALQQAASARLMGTRSAWKGTILMADPQASGRVQWRVTGEVWLPDGTPITGRELTPEAPADLRPPSQRR